MSSNWDEVRKYVEPVVADINQPNAGVIFRVEVVVEGDDQPSVNALFNYDAPTRALNVALMRYAARLIAQDADRLEQRPGPWPNYPESPSPSADAP